MTMNFTNVVKGQITQGLVKTLLERAGYRVTRLGVEELFNEVIHLSSEKYKKLNLPLNLRFLPDLLVAEQNLARASLVEVKFRNEFTEKSAKELYSTLKKQRRYWVDSYAVIIIAKSWADDNRFHQDYIRVVPPNETERLIDTKWIKQPNPEKNFECVWKALPRMDKIFSKFKWSSDNDNSANADLITMTIKDLRKLS